MGLLRDSFDAATSTFLESEDSANFHRRIELLKEAQCLPREYISPGDIDKFFLKGNMKLISDIWAPVLDVYDDGVLLKAENVTFAKHIYSATMCILPTFITLVYEPQPAGEMTTTVKTNAIINADVEILELGFPRIRRPPKWNRRRQTVTKYGYLSTCLVDRREQEEELAEELDECTAASNINEFDFNPCMDPNLPVKEHSATLMDEMKRVSERAKAQIRMILQMRMELEECHDQLDTQLRFLTDTIAKRAQFMALHVGRVGKVDAIKNILNDAAAHFKEIERSCMDSIIEGKAAHANEDVLELYQNFAGVVAYLKGKGYIRTQLMPIISPFASTTSSAGPSQVVDLASDDFEHNANDLSISSSEPVKDTV